MTDALGSTAGDVVGGRYRLDAVLGRGGMAVVWRATDLKLDRAVAVKVFRAELAEAIDPQRTARETHLLAGVDHPAVVGALDASTGDAPVTYLVMELVEGADLKTLLKGGALEVDRTRRILADVAGALAVLHSRGVVHRDVKPANILVVDERERQRIGITAKLTDFGIAQAVDSARITSTDLILGTAAYLSPEQVRGEPVGPASDVFSAGLVLAECLSGRRAFPGPPAEAAVARLNAAPPVPAEASPELAALLTAMTALDPADRPAASAVAATLRDLAGAMTAPDAEDTALVPRPAPSLLAAGAAAVPAAAVPFEDAVAFDDEGLLGEIPVGGDPYDDDPDDGDPSPRRRPLLVPAIAALTVGLLAGVGALLSAPLLFGSTPTAHHAAAPAGSGAALPPGDAVSAGSPAPSPGPTSAGSTPSRLLKATHVAVPAPVPAAGSSSGGDASGSTASSSPSSSPSPSAVPTRTASATPTPTAPPTSSPPPSAGPSPSPSGTVTPPPTPKPTRSAPPSSPAPSTRAPSPSATPTGTPSR